MITKLVKRGDDYLLVFDETIVQQFGFNENTQVKISVEHGALVITPLKTMQQADEASTKRSD